MSDTYRVRSVETWAQARDDYLAGLDAALVCERHDVGLSALRKRAKAESWRKVDQPDPEPAFVAFDPHAPVQTIAEMAELAWRRMAFAVKHDRPLDALRWLKLHQNLSAAARSADSALASEPSSPLRRRGQGDGGRPLASAVREHTLHPSPSHSLHTFHSKSATTPPAAIPHPQPPPLKEEGAPTSSPPQVHTFHSKPAPPSPDPGVVARLRNDLARARRKRRPDDEAATLARLRILGVADP